MLDPGIELEPERRAVVRELAKIEPSAWNTRSLAKLKENMTASGKGIPLKYAYGSDFPYRDPGNDQAIKSTNVGIMPSLAKGGLSNVWGSAILPFRQDDMRDWPVTASQLAEHYRSVFQFMPLAGRRDGLEQWFDLYTDRPQPLDLSPQAEAFLNDLQAAQPELAAGGLHFGASRLALQSEQRNGWAGCRYCGQCMYGCPYEVPYNSAATVEHFRSNPNFDYRPGVFVRRLKESSSTVQIDALDLSNRDAITFTAGRVFVACGVLSTTRLIAASLEAFDQPLTLHDSQYFLLPLLRYRKVQDFDKAKSHTLAQVFLEIFDKAIADSGIHLQIYTYNDLFDSALRSMFGPLMPLINGPARAMMSRMLLIQGYLPSGLSPSISAVLSRKGDHEELQLEPIANPTTQRTLRRVINKLTENRHLLRAVPISWMVKPGTPGRGFHVGGSFPMRATPGPLECDRLGRPYGLDRVHIADATNFPSIPATTITLTAMANAHRIGSEAVEL